MTDWWRELYDLQHEIWPAWSRGPGRSEETVDFLSAWLGLGGDEVVLDLGCGVGREVVEFARRGHAALGVEISPTLVDCARERGRAATVGEHARFIEADFRSFESEERFDLAYFWDSSLNVFDLDEAGDVLSRVAHLLRPGGWLVIEQLNEACWKGVNETIEIRSEEIGPGHTVRTYRYDEASGRLLDSLVHHPPGQAEGRSLPTQRLRLYTQPEIRSLLGRVGLEEVDLAASHEWRWTAPPADPEDPKARSICARGRRPAPA